MTFLPSVSIELFFSPSYFLLFFLPSHLSFLASLIECWMHSSRIKFSYLIFSRVLIKSGYLVGTPVVLLKGRFWSVVIFGGCAS